MKPFHILFFGRPEEVQQASVSVSGSFYGYQVDHSTAQRSLISNGYSQETTFLEGNWVEKDEMVKVHIDCDKD